MINSSWNKFIWFISLINNALSKESVETEVLDPSDSCFELLKETPSPTDPLLGLKFSPGADSNVDTNSQEVEVTGAEEEEFFNADFYLQEPGAAGSGEEEESNVDTNPQEDEVTGSNGEQLPSEKLVFEPANPKDPKATFYIGWFDMPTSNIFFWTPNNLYNNLSKLYLERRQSLAEGLYSIVKYKGMSTDAMSAIITHEISKKEVKKEVKKEDEKKDNEKKDNDKKESELDCFKDVSILFKDLTDRNLFEIIFKDNVQAYENYKLLKSALKAYKKSKASEEYIPFSEACVSLLQNLKKLIDKSELIKNKDFYFKFDTALKDISNKCCLKFLNLDEALNDPEYHQFQLISKVTAKTFVRHLEKNHQIITQTFNKISEELVGEDDNTKVLEKNAEIIYKFSNDFFIVDSIISLLKNIKNYNKKTIFSWSFLTSLKRKYSEQLSMELSRLTLNLLMKAKGYEDDYYSTKKNFFCAENVNWWFTMKIYEAFDIKLMGELSASTLETMVSGFKRKFEEHCEKIIQQSEANKSYVKSSDFRQDNQEAWDFIEMLEKASSKLVDEEDKANCQYYASKYKDILSAVLEGARQEN